MRYSYLLLAAILAGCAPKADVDPSCVGNDGATYSCSAGSSCSRSGGSGCSKAISGVSCCYGGGGGGNDGTSNCELGWCWTVENICCPRSAPYPCNGYCYASNVCNYTSIRTACHDW